MRTCERSRSDQQKTGRIIENLRTIVEYARGLDPEFDLLLRRTFKTSCIPSIRSLAKYCLVCRRIACLTRAEGKTVLDAGSGFGLVGMLLAQFEAKRVFGLEIRRNAVRLSARIASQIDLSNFEVLVGCGLHIPFDDGIFDVVVANNVISHVRDFQAFRAEVGRVLRRGGLLYISDDNNSLDVFHRTDRRRRWRMCEYGPHPDAIEGAPAWLHVRKNMISAQYPLMKEKTLNFLARITAGMYGEEIPRAVDQYLREGAIRTKPHFKFRDPKTGGVEEAEFNPLVLTRIMTKTGFRCRVQRPYFSSAIGRIITALHPFSLIIAPKFEIVATKL